MARTKQLKYVAVVAKVTPATKELIEKMAKEQTRSISQEIRRTLEATYGN